MASKSVSHDPRLTGVTLLNVQQVAALLGLHPRTVWKMALTGEIPPPIRVGAKSKRWRLSDLQQFVGRKGVTV